MGNLVARRCRQLESAKDRELIWFLQLLSHREGGLQKLARELFAGFPERNATPSMRQFGMKPGQTYTPAQVKAVRAEMPNGEEDFVLRGELTGIEAITLPDVPEAHQDPLGSEREEALRCHAEATERANRRPATYKAEAFCEACRKAAAELPNYLAELCLNPAIGMDESGPWYFPALVETLREYQAAWIERRRQEVVFTELGRKVCETLEYSREERCLTVTVGPARMGKTHAAKAWCELNPGAARYVQVPSTNDEIGFYRAIAKSLGVSINLNSKAQELRQRIEETLEGGHLTVVLDEAHYLWPNLIDTRSLPARINCIMTALLNQGVAVAMVTTPQFIKTQKVVETKTRWTSEQFTGRIGHYEPLPDSLSESDLFSVARALLPEGEPASLEMLVRYAQGSAKYLAGIETATRRARFLARQDGRAEVARRDVKRAITESVIPSDSALAEALNAAGRRERRVAVPALDSILEPAIPQAIVPRRDARPAPLANNRAHQAALAPC
jgi:hypothetical protein